MLRIVGFVIDFAFLITAKLEALQILFMMTMHKFPAYLHFSEEINDLNLCDDLIQWFQAGGNMRFLGGNAEPKPQCCSVL